ncbi:uncharacterized protein LOC136026894 isoform X2 [Artemia franciscana]|uniref:uncharacterized protein LOC136026894 isoform X2 n=1 Tax=Artemia franciscana TaxID=6661 RepID=UPI0032DA759A
MIEKETEEQGKQRDAAHSHTPTERLHLNIEKELTHSQKVAKSLVSELENLHLNEESQILNPEGHEDFGPSPVLVSRRFDDRWEGEDEEPVKDSWEADDRWEGEDEEPVKVKDSWEADDRWEGEDEEPVKDSWEAEETKKKSAKHGVSKPKTRKRKTPEQKIAEKEIIVHGVAEMDPHETAESAFLSICNENFPHLSVHKNDLISSRRIGKQGSRPRPIIVQFSNLSIRQFLLKNKYRVRAAGITFDETMTNSKLALRNYAKFCLGSRSVWVSNGEILHRTSSNNIIKIFSKKDVDNLLKG